MRGVALFAAGLVLGAAMHTISAQGVAGQPSAMRLNHVAISVPDINQALKWYGDNLGIREVIRNTGQDGQLMAAYIQVSRDTFIELQQSNAQRPVGVNHFGFEVPDIKAAVASFRQRGLTVSDPTGPSAFSGGFLANITEPNVGRIEITEQPPDGKLRKATESWK